MMRKNSHIPRVKVIAAVLMAMISLMAMLAACTPSQPPVVPTLVVLPSATATQPSATPELRPQTLTATAPPTNTDTETATTAPTETNTLEPSLAAPEVTAEVTAEAITEVAQVIGGTPTFVTFTPSATLNVTYTPAPTRTATPTEPPPPAGLELLAMLSAQFTVLPPEVRYNEATRTALAIAVTQQALNPAGAATPTTSPPLVATFPPPGSVGGAPVSTPVCSVPPPAMVSTLLAGEPSLLASLGCSIGQPLSLSTASQTFERGSMIYVSGTPGEIYALFSDGRFRRFPDTWVAGVDPDSGGEIPPAGRYEPIRGFGKVWRTNPDVRNNLSWGTSTESGASASILYFTGGRVMYLPQRNETLIVIDDVGSGGASGSWRSFIGGF